MDTVQMTACIINDDITVSSFIYAITRAITV